MMTQQNETLESIRKVCETHDIHADTIQVIRVEWRKGGGFEGSPVRRVTSYFHMDGRPLAEEDVAKGAEA
jgi:hypothetical protein